MDCELPGRAATTAPLHARNAAMLRNEGWRTRLTKAVRRAPCKLSRLPMRPAQVLVSTSSTDPTVLWRRCGDLLGATRPAPSAGDRAAPSTHARVYLRSEYTSKAQSNMSVSSTSLFARAPQRPAQFVNLSAFRSQPRAHEELHITPWRQRRLNVAQAAAAAAAAAEQAAPGGMASLLAGAVPLAPPGSLPEAQPLEQLPPYSEWHRHPELLQG